MDMRDRLIDLINSALDKCNMIDCIDDGYCIYDDHSDDHPETDCQLLLIADHLIENGVILPPVKVGDVVYCIQWRFNDLTLKREFKIKPVFVSYMKAEILNTRVDWMLECEGLIFLNSDIGKNVFLSRKQAEKALEEMEDNHAKNKA